MTLTLRPYQTEAIQTVKREWEKVDATMLVAATGLGKTVIFNSLLADVLTPGKRGLILAHRRELITQPLDRLAQHYPALALRAGVVMAHSNQVASDLIVATVQTLASEKRLRQVLAHGKIDYLVTDECHHATANAYQKLYATLQEVNPHLKHLGVTATPVRADGDGLSKTYHSVAAKYDIGWGIQNGFLAPVRWLEVKTGISLKGIRSQAGDFSARQLADVFETGNCFDLVVHTHQKYGLERPFLAYTVSVEGAHTLAAKFNAAGIPVGSADASTPDDTRKQLIRKLERGELKGLVNMGLWTEGLDIPQVSLIHQVRPTQSDGLYVQIIGRALRTYPGKADALILDYAPKDARNIAMFGDILGVPLDKKEYTERETQEAEEEEVPIQAGFTFDGEYRFLNGDPMEIVVRELHYLEQSPWSWHRAPDGWLTLGLGKAADQIERTLVMRPPQNGKDDYTLYGVAKRPVQFDHEGQPVRWGNEQAHYLKSAPFEELHALAEAYANKHGSAVLAGKQRGWRNEPPSMGQIQYARRLGIFHPGLSKGELANRITMHLAVRAVERGL